MLLPFGGRSQSRTRGEPPRSCQGRRRGIERECLDDRTLDWNDMATHRVKQDDRQPLLQPPAPLVEEALVVAARARLWREAAHCQAQVRVDAVEPELEVEQVRVSPVEDDGLGRADQDHLDDEEGDDLAGLVRRHGHRRHEWPERLRPAGAGRGNRVVEHEDVGALLSACWCSLTSRRLQRHGLRVEQKEHVRRRDRRKVGSAGNSIASVGR
jgi:hypothetical protein